MGNGREEDPFLEEEDGRLCSYSSALIVLGGSWKRELEYRNVISTAVQRVECPGEHNVDTRGRSDEDPGATPIRPPEQGQIISPESSGWSEYDQSQRTDT